ncbi:M20 family metallo-hydrolase [Sporosarcina luteola]|uniref:M20 family metallo-hydrolase n=1 Tax=Sporosarcina luteola TaxID=582850 RepID=UPI0020414ED2|nr:M20 family metallo-hydrolase [Sporosarcina luteola]MCM3745370.1 M20 family metallo-hydrolase [Sporosarcina luteola]
MKRQVVNLERLMETLKISNKIGLISETGVRRIALTQEDKIMRDIFMGWLEEEGLEVRVDDFGNIYGRREGLRNDLTPVMTGSHLDTQPYGGRYDGILGVLSGLEIIKVLNENNVQTLRPIEVVNFTNEEGYRFFPSTTSGSDGICNILTKECIYETTDENGYSFEEELKKIGYLGDEKNRAKDIYSFVELHIEQGPILEQKNKSIGIVEGDKGIKRIEFSIKGKTSHSTGTPMEGRKDALLKAAEIVVAIHQIAKEKVGTIINIGKFKIEPGAVSHIPCDAKFTMHITHQDENILDELIESIKKKSSTIVAEEKMEIEINAYSSLPKARFSKEIMNEIEEVAHDFGYSTLRMLSGGGHDANNIATIAPTGMVFIPCKDGVSHSVEEFASEEDIEKGVNVLLNVVLKLAQQEDNLEQEG